MQTRHAATIAAFPRKESLGGGFRGVYLCKVTGERLESDVVPTLDEARHAAKRFALEKHPTSSLAPYRRKGEYLANVWVQA